MVIKQFLFLRADILNLSLTHSHAHPLSHYVIVPNTGLCRQILGPYSSYDAFVWHTW